CRSQSTHRACAGTSEGAEAATRSGRSPFRSTGQNRPQNRRTRQTGAPYDRRGCLNYVESRRRPTADRIGLAVTHAHAATQRLWQLQPHGSLAAMHGVALWAALDLGIGATVEVELDVVRARHLEDVVD